MVTDEERAELRRLADGIRPVNGMVSQTAYLAFAEAAETAVPALLAEVERLERERDEALDVLRPNVRESGLVDACRQRMQAYVSERDNCVVLLRERDALRAWVARALEALEAIDEPDHSSHCLTSIRRRHGKDGACDCHVAALRAVLGDAPKEKP